MPGHRLNPLSATERRARKHRLLFSQQNGLCFYCRRRMVLTLDETNPLRFTRDHKHPQSKGGFNAPSNIVGACSACNSAKDDMGLDAFLAILAAAPSIEAAHTEARRLRSARDASEAKKAARHGHRMVVDTTFGPVATLGPINFARQSDR